MIITDNDMRNASAELGTAIAHLAEQASTVHGVHMVLSATAPNTWEALAAEGERMHRTGRLHIWDGASDTSLYGTERNHAFRFWHDLGHLSTGLTFTPEDERALQHKHHIGEIERAGIRSGSLAHTLYVADTVGQIEHIVAYGCFPADQRAFVRHLVSTGEVRQA